MSGPPTPGQRIFLLSDGGRIPRVYQARHINPPAETMIAATAITWRSVMGQYNYHVAGLLGRGHDRKWNRIKYGFALLEMRSNQKFTWYQWVGTARTLRDAQAWVEHREAHVKMLPDSR